MKTKIISLCVAASLVLGFFGLSFLLKKDESILWGQTDGRILATNDEEKDISEAVLDGNGYTVSENDDYIMELNGNADLVIRHKKSGTVWSAVPADSTLSSRFSSLMIDYYKDNATKQTLFSAENSVEKGQVKVFSDEKGVRVEYILGEMQVEYIYPQMIEKSRMEGFMAKMESGDVEFIERRYSLYELEFFSEEDKKTLIYQYPRLENEDLYIMTEEPTKRNKARLHEVFEKAGYTEEDQKLDNAGSDLSEALPETFRITLCYELLSDGFTVSVDTADVAFYRDYPIKSISLLPTFDANLSGDTGYFMLPSGSGALMRAESEEGFAEVTLPVYGNNLASVPDYSPENERVVLPVFGQYKNGRGYLCVVEDAPQQAEVYAIRDSGYSSVSVNFNFLDTLNTSLSSKNNVTFFADDFAAERFSLRYILIPEETEATAYSEMANICRSYLTDKGLLGEKRASADPKLLAEVVNVISYDDLALGFIPKSREFAVTDYSQTAAISMELSEITGSENLSLLVTGWNRSGSERQSLGKIKPSPAAGGKKEFKNLFETLKAEGITSYIDLNFTLSESYRGDGFNPSSDAVRSITNSIVRLRVRDALLNSYTETSYALVSPTKQSEILESYQKSDMLLADGIGVSGLTALLYGDYRNELVLSRGDAINEYEKLLSAASSSKKLLGDFANLYALRYAELVNNMPVSSEGLGVFYRDVPFVQMVLHGSVDYVSEDMSAASDGRKALLRLIESGSGMHYRLTANSFEELFSTDHSDLYNTNYSSKSAEIEENYRLLRDALGGLSDETVTEHIYLTDKVVRVTYSDGTVIYVNYSDKDYTENGVTVGAENYLRSNSDV